MRAATIVLALLALWWALRGLSRTLRADVRLTARGLVYLVLSGAALAGALWLRAAEPGDVVDLLVATAEALGLDDLWERLTGAIRDAIPGIDALD